MRAALRGVIAAIAVLTLVSSLRLALAQPAPPPDPQRPFYTPGELVNTGHRFFGGVSSGLASLIERAVGLWGLPNRGSAWAFFWLSLAVAVGCTVYGFVDRRFFLGGLMVFAALRTV